MPLPWTEQANEFSLTHTDELTAEILSEQVRKSLVQNAPERKTCNVYFQNVIQM